MRKLNALRAWRRFGGSRTALVVALVATLAAGLFGSGALLISHAFSGSPKVQAHKPGRPSKKDEGAWFQLSHFGKSLPAPDARAKALQRASQLPISPLAGAASTSAAATGTANANLATAGGGWTSLGPVGEDSSTCPSYCNNYGINSGRITAEAVNPSNGNDIWVGAADGGLWRSTDGGAHWTSVSDNSTVNGAAWPTLSIGAIAIDPSNASTIYVGTGESNLNGDAYWGVGVFKSTDSGAHWTQYGASQFGGLGFAKLAVDPHNSSTILAAVGFNGFNIPSGGNVPWANTGIWQSTDAGQTWTQVLHNIGDGPGKFDAGTDLAFDPAHSGEVFAGLANSFGAPASSFSSGAGVWYSANSGGSWSKLSIGIPTGNDIERVSLGLSADGMHVYAALTDGDTRDYPSEPAFGNLLNSSIYASVNNGQLWTAVSISGVSGMANDDNGQQWWYDSYVAVDPTDANTVYVGGVDIWQTQAGEASITSSWKNLTNVYTVSPVGPHPDEHALVFVPGSSNYYIGNDGGVWSGTKAGAFINRNTGGLNITQFYQGSIGEVGGAAELYGGAQDNGELRYPGTSVTTAAQWNATFGGDGGDTAVDFTDNHIAYEEYVGGRISKTTDGGATWTAATTGINICNVGCDPVSFVAPFAMSQGDHNTLVMGTDRVYKTTNAAASWTAISGSLDAGRPLTAIAVAPTNGGYIYAGTSNGDVYSTSNGGATWTAVPWSALNPVGIVTGISVDPTSPNVAYLTFSGFVNTAGQHVFKTTDAGSHWADISGSLPNVPVESVAVDPANANLVVACSDAGVFVTQDAGATWANLGAALPNASVNSVFFSHTGGRLFVATHGRGMWELPLAQFAANPSAIEVTTPPGGSPAAQTVALKNTGFAPLNWTLNATFAPSWLGVTPSSGTLAPGQSQNLTFTFSMPATPTPHTYTAQVRFNDPHAANDSFAVPVTVVASSVSKAWYFAEGYIGGSFQTIVTVANPNSSPATVTFTYHLDQNGGVVSHQNVVLAANSRYTEDVNKWVHQLTGNSVGYGVATTVTSDQPVVAERPMYYTYANSNTGQAVRTGFDVVGATTLGASFDFGYLDTTANHRTLLLALNPTVATMYMNVTYYPAAGGASTLKQHTIPANARGGVDIGHDEGLPAGVYSATVTLSADAAGLTPVSGLVERPMYLANPSTGAQYATCLVGVAQPTTSAYFAEGFTGADTGAAHRGQFYETLYLAYPAAAGATASVSVTIYKETGGAPVVVPVTLAPGHIQMVDVNGALPGYGLGNSIKVIADQPILAQRLMTFDYGASDVLGAPAPSYEQLFAEGFTGGGFDEIVTVQNPNAATAYVAVTFLPEFPSTSNPAKTVVFAVAPQSRYTFLANTYMPNQGFSMQTVSDVPVLIERPMYWSGGETDVIGYQPDGSLAG